MTGDEELPGRGRSSDARAAALAHYPHEPAPGPVPVTSGVGFPIVSSDSPSLEALSRRVRGARAAVHLQRHRPASALPLAKARHSLIVALEDYVTALETRRLPVPHTLKLELQLHHDLFD